MHLYLRAGFSSPALASFFLICMGDSKGVGVIPRPAVYHDRHIKTKIKAYCDKVYTKFCDLNVAKDDTEHESFTVIFIDSLLAYKKTVTFKFT